MYRIYYTDLESQKTTQIKELKKGCWINMVSPTESEIAYICKSLDIDEEAIRYCLDRKSVV